MRQQANMANPNAKCSLFSAQPDRFCSPLVAVQHIRRMNGGTQSHLLRASDGALYITKFQNNPQHARILADAGGYFVEDLGSANGTFLNDRRLPGGVPTRLRNGDRVRIGKVQCTFTLGG